MNLRTHTARPLVVLILAVLTTGASIARGAGVDYVGYAWETGGIASSLPGDRLSIATVVTQIDPLFDVDLNSVEATLFIEGLTSQGAAFNPSTGVTTIVYSGGTIAIHAGAFRNHDWGTSPANATVPGTFTDGDLIFLGVFNGFVINLLPSGAGVYEGTVDGTGGSALAGPCSSCAYTFAGTFAAPTGAQIPAGYDLQVDGVLDVESAVSVETMNWGSLKLLFNADR